MVDNLRRPTGFCWPRTIPFWFALVSFLFGLVVAADSQEPFAGLLVIMGPSSWLLYLRADEGSIALGWFGLAVLLIFLGTAYITLRRPGVVAQVAFCVSGSLWLVMGTVSAYTWLAMCEKGGSC